MTSSGPPLGHHPDCRRGARSGACPSVAAAGADGPDRGRGRRDCVSGTLDFGLNFTLFHSISFRDMTAHAPMLTRARLGLMPSMLTGTVLWPCCGRVLAGCARISAVLCGATFGKKKKTSGRSRSSTPRCSTRRARPQHGHSTVTPRGHSARDRARTGYTMRMVPTVMMVPTPPTEPRRRSERSMRHSTGVCSWWPRSKAAVRRSTPNSAAGCSATCCTAGSSTSDGRVIPTPPKARTAAVAVKVTPTNLLTFDLCGIENLEKVEKVEKGGTQVKFTLCVYVYSQPHHPVMVSTMLGGVEFPPTPNPSTPRARAHRKVFGRTNCPFFSLFFFTPFFFVQPRHT